MREVLPADSLHLVDEIMAVCFCLDKKIGQRHIAVVCFHLPRAVLGSPHDPLERF